MEQKGRLLIVICYGRARFKALPEHDETKIIIIKGK
ncbi:hypothetical protein [Neobacillus mesonae]